MKIVISCCTRFFGEGLKLILERDLREHAPSIECCSDPRSLFMGNPDLLILDHTVFSSLTPELFVNNGCKALLLGTSCAPLIERSLLATLVSMGLAGIVASNTDASTFSRSVAAVISGELWLSSVQVRDLLQAETTTVPETTITLTDKEREIVSLLCRGYRNKAIMEHLHISEQAVKSHLSRIGRKFGVTDRLQIVLSALKCWPHLMQEDKNPG